IKAVLESEQNLQCSVTLLSDASAVLTTPVDRLPDLLIADPALLSQDSFNRLHESGVPVPALQLHLMSQSLSDRYDGVVSLTDRPADFCSKIINLLKSESSSVAPSAKASELSPREKEVVCALVKGCSNKEIASEMNVSVNTIMTHRRNIASKLQLHSPAALTIYALATGLVSLDDVKASLEL
ncbi:MAG: LuxR C-terminal-related transcriptional regulator, partial [Duncaniella sp.]|nr:LuxR C-terminal-related transcriptional regulator [Duncaniella sp.]